MNAPLFSFIIPVYNRPDELAENLESLTHLSFNDFEVVIIEDGSKIKSDQVVNVYKSRLHINYHFKKNEGPSIGRNVGANLAKGEFLIFVDSDCIMPPQYLDVINDQLNDETDVFGGPDRAHESFTPLQKAINFSMTSLLTTGGIRGQKKSVDRYYPRSFNLGIKRSVFLEMGGFPKTKMHPGEDMVFGIELIKRGYTTQYIHDAHVFHKRRTSIKQFYHQIRKFGKVRYYISRMYPATFKISYLLPLGFTLFTLFSTVMFLFDFKLPAASLGFYTLLILVFSSLENKSIQVGLLSVITTFIQFCAYAVGLTYSALRHIFTGIDEYDVLNKPLFE